MRKRNWRSALWIAAAALIVLAVIGTFAYLDQSSIHRSGIVLPSDSAQESGDDAAQEHFAVITPENAPALVRAMERPTRYHQTLKTLTAGESATAESTTEVWYADGVWKLEHSESGQTRHLLLDGETAYLWYGDDRTVKTVPAPSDVTADDLIGVPTYETIAQLSPQAVLAASYETPEELSDAPCLFVQTEDTGYWVDLSTGLLCKAERYRGDAVSVRVLQTAFAVPNADDSALAAAMRLPNGQTVTAAKTQQS